MILAIDSIRTDGGTQPRGFINSDVVESYHDAMQAGAKFPPVDVFFDGSTYWLADGFHRVKATLARDIEKIECSVHQGTIEDAQWFSFGANKLNGLYRSNADKQRAIQAALGHPKASGLSDRAIAMHVGTGHSSVSEWRNKLTVQNGQSSLRIGKDGRTINTEGIGKTKQVDETHASRILSVAEVRAVEATQQIAQAPEEADAPVVEAAPVYAVESRDVRPIRVCDAIRALIETAMPADEFAEFISGAGWDESISAAHKFLGSVVLSVKLLKERSL